MDEEGVAGSRWCVALHGGSAEAWADGQDQEVVKTALREIAEAAGQSLGEGEEAKRVVLDAVIALEDCPYFNAGHGAVLNRDGHHELEAGIVDGRTGHYGAVACLTTVKNPIVAANLMLAGEPSNGWEFGTVGVVALDRYGGLAAGGSTGGTTCKIPGRIGDTAILNAGLLANTEVAIVCSGAGDEVLRRGIAAKIAMYQQNMATSLDEATHRAVLEMAEASNQPSSLFSTTLPVFPQHCVVETPYIMAGLSRYPTARGQVIAVTRDGDLLRSNNLVSHIAVAQRIARALKSIYSVARCALVSDGSDTFSIVPLHGPLAAFGPMLNTREEFDEFFPGWIVSNEGPRMDDRRLHSICEQIRAVSGYCAQYDAIPDNDNVFAGTIHKESLQWKVWEDDCHVAFLAAYPNTPGLTVLLPKAELGSDVFELSADDLSDLVRAASTVAQMLRRALNVRRCGMIVEGYERQQAHIKLIPIHEMQNNDESPSDCGNQEEFEEAYPGWVTSKPGPPLNDRRELSEQASVVRALLEQ
ncbi:nucleophile aminohydrolase [Cryomyces antarcticus]